MKKITRIIILLLLVSAILIPTAASASDFGDDKVIFGSNYTLREGETLNGDLVVFGGNATLEVSSTINGDAVVFGGNLTANGTVNGNLVGLGGIVTLGDDALVQGDLTVVSGAFDQSPSAVVTGNLVTEENLPLEFELPENGLFQGDAPIPNFRQLPVFSPFWFVFRLLIWTGLAILLSLFIEDQAAVVNRTSFREPVMSFVVGLGVVIVGPFLFLALIFTLILSPISLVGFFALIAAWVVGLVALSIEVGRKLSRSLNWNLPVPVMAGMGMFILALFFNGFSQLVFCVGWLPKFILGAWVMGAVILTRFGTHPYPEEKDPAEREDGLIPDSFPASEIPESGMEKTEINATAAAVELAETEGIDLAAITGTGSQGRIILNDVRKAIKERDQN